MHEDEIKEAGSMGLATNTTGARPVTDIERIAASLSPAQKRFVKMPFYSCVAKRINAAWFHDTRDSVARKIAKRGLAERRLIEPGYCASVPTRLGLQVRDHLTQQEKQP